MIGVGRRGCPLLPLQLREEDAGLALCRLRRVRPVHEVRLHLEAEVAADRARRSLERVGRADHLARGLHCLVALEHHRHERAGRARILAVGQPNTPGEFAHQLAWELRIHLEDVGGGRPPAVIFTGPPPPFAAQPLPTKHVRVTFLASGEVWKAYAVVPARR